MRIALVTPYDLVYEGGVNHHVIALAQALRHLGHTVHVLGPASGPVAPRLHGLKGVVSVSANGSTARLGLLVSPRAVRRFLRAGRFDIIHVHEPWLPGIAHHAVTSGEAPVVGTFHSYADSQTLTVRVVRRALGRRVRGMQGAIAVSKAAAEFARTVFRGPIRVVPNGVDTARFTTPAPLQAAAEPSEDAAKAPLRVLFVGRFDEPRKGLQHLLEAAALIRQDGRAMDVRIAGYGDPAPFGRLATAAGARFLGRLGDVDLADAYRASDVFCAPSTHGESFGLVLIEAMACGGPVVASDIRGYREAAAGAALLVRHGDAASLASAIVRTADDHALRRRLIARGHWRARELSWDRVVHDVADTYRNSLIDLNPERVLGASR